MAIPGRIYSHFNSHFLNRMYAGKLEFLPASHSGHTTDGNVCYAGCETCENAASFCANNPIALGKERRKEGRAGSSGGILKEDSHSRDGEEEEEEPRWQTWSTKFHSLIAVGVTARSRVRPEGDSPFTHLGDGTVELLVVSECTRREIVKMARKGGFLSSDTVVPRRVRAFRFTPLNAEMEEIVSEKEAKARRKKVVKVENEEEEEDEVAASRPLAGVGRGMSSHSIKSSVRGSASVGQMSAMPSRYSMLDQPDTAIKMPVASLKKDVMVVQASNESVATSVVLDNHSSNSGENNSGGGGGGDSNSSGRGSSLGPLQSSPVHRPTCFPQFSSGSEAAGKAKNREVSVWTSDGEIDFSQKAIVCYVHCQLLPIFGHGVDKQMEQ